MGESIMTETSPAEPSPIQAVPVGVQATVWRIGSKPDSGCRRFSPGIETPETMGPSQAAEKLVPAAICEGFGSGHGFNSLP
jgi:hypothetical protein